jgi:hypothetical protein
MDGRTGKWPSPALWRKIHNRCPFPESQATLVSVLRWRHSCDDLHRLDGFRRDLIRVQTALLIRHRLVRDISFQPETEQPAERGRSPPACAR